MPQMPLPIFPAGVTPITALLACSNADGRVTDCNGSMPVLVHDESERASLQMITAQCCVNGNAKQMDLVRAFGVSKLSPKRAVQRSREQGPRGFNTPPRKRRGPAVLTAPVLPLGTDQNAAVARRGLGARRGGRSTGAQARHPLQSGPCGAVAQAGKKSAVELTSKRERSAADRVAPMGGGRGGCGRPLGGQRR